MPPLPRAGISTSMRPRRASTCTRNLLRSSRPEKRSPPDAFNVGRGRASAAELPPRPMWAAAGVQRLYKSSSLIRGTKRARGSERPATLLAYATAAESSKRRRADFLLASSLYSPRASPCTHSPSQLIPSLVASLGHVPGMNWSPTVAPQPGNGRQLVGP